MRSLEEMSMTSGKFYTFVGVVEDIMDPEQIGRVRVRCIGYHTDNKTQIPTSALPWATIVSSPWSAAISGIGASPHGLLPGSWVVGFFRDGASAQDPMVLGSISSYSASSINTQRGFCDPSGAYPTKLGAKDIPEETSKPSESLTSSGLPITSNPEYPHNLVYKTKSGHIIEIDDTPNHERVQITHKSGSFIVFGDDGKVGIYAADDLHLKGKNVIVRGDTIQLNPPS